MEHEVFVPVAAEPLRQALADPLRVARAVPGLQQDAGEAPVSGRLKVRVGHSSITYRGALRIAGQDDGSYAVEGDAVEARGSGEVKVSLTLRLTGTEGGTTLAFGGTVTGSGRIAELDAGVADSTGRRLLARFAEALATEASPARGTGATAGAGTEPEAEAESHSGTEAPAEPAEKPRPGRDGASVFETEVPPPSLDPSVDDDPVVDDATDYANEYANDEAAEADETDEAEGGTEPPAEAAHARRTMIGRSAEEVDHSPPRGRYAPVPAPDGLSASATLRWAAPAAALVVASVIVIGRALRRRR